MRFLTALFEGLFKTLRLFRYRVETGSTFAAFGADHHAELLYA
jgi:hypothetical protein